MIPTEQIEQWLEEEKRATQGLISNTHIFDGEEVITTADMTYIATLKSQIDANLIVTARNNWRRVLEENLQLKAEVERMKNNNFELRSSYQEVHNQMTTLRKTMYGF